jgi:uncharacterized protein YkwD
VRRHIVGTLAAALAAGALGSTALASGDAATSSLPSCKGNKAHAGAEKALTRLINLERRRRGQPALRRVTSLVRNARAHNRWMLTKRTFAHPSRLKFGGGRRASQNLAYMQTPKAAVRGLMKSPPHRANMIGRGWRKVGIGATSCRGMLLFTVNITA